MTLEQSELIDALCVRHLGWRTDGDHATFDRARNHVLEHGLVVRKREAIRILERKLAELKGEPNEPKQ